MSLRKRKDFNDLSFRQAKKHRFSSGGINFYIPMHKLDLSDDTNKNKKFTNKTSTETASVPLQVPSPVVSAETLNIH